MNSSIDQKTKQFYMEIGYSEPQIIKAYEYSIRNKIDILDALSVQTRSVEPSPPPSKKPTNNYVQAPPPEKGSNLSFLTPFSRIKVADYETLYSRSSKFNPSNSKYQLRDVNNPVGLLNISNCCYLNSLIQCYFLMDKFKEILLLAQPLDDIDKLLAENKTKLKRVKNQYELLGKLKNFFTLMSLTSKRYLDPSDVLQNLVDSVGQKISYGQQKDLSEINIMIIQRLSQGLTFTKKFFKNFQEPTNSRSSFIDEGENRGRFNSIFNPQKGFIKQLFYGTKVEYYEQQQKQQPIVSDFTGIIINPNFGTLQHALDEQFNFSVEIKGQLFKKQMYIRQQPQYLFLYINRTQYDRQQQQMLKNDQKFVFDFVLYMDRYLQKYKKQRNQKDLIVRKLIHQRNKIKQQISNLQMLYQKMQQCYHYANQLQGWSQKLPNQQEFDQQQNRLNQKLADVQHQLQQIQSRNQQYHLMYIFVHRGDAVSGHYWGYGRNGSNWYRFDINCRLIAQDQIIIDIQKSSGTPYALLYVKKNNIPQTRYNYHIKHNYKQGGDLFFYQHFDEKLAQEIIKQNILIHNEIQIRNNQIIKKKCLSDYINRYNAVIKTFKKIIKPKEQSNQLDNLDICNNFSLFLYSKKQLEIFKFSIFQQSLLAASNNKINIQKLMNDADLLPRIQKKFKLKCKGQLSLKNYAIVGKDLEKYIKYQQEYQLNVFEAAWNASILSQMEIIHNIINKIQFNPGHFFKIQITGSLQTSLSLVLKYLKIRNIFYKGNQYKKIQQHIGQPVYITQINNQISKLIILTLVVYGFKFESLQQYMNISDASGFQIASINSSNSISFANLGYEPSENLIEQIQQIIKKQYLTGKKNNQSDSAIKNDRRPSAKPNQNSPLKSVAFFKQSSKEKRLSESKLISSNQVSVVLDIREIWKIEELENLQANFGLSTKTMQFLKKSSLIIKIYKKTLQLERALTFQQLKDLGVSLNQPKHEQSLI